MANLKSSIKDIRRTARRTERNLARVSRIQSAMKAVRAATTPEEGRQALRQASSLLDRAARKDVMHWRSAARQKARLARFVAEKFPAKA